jgi:hypothetical protein
MKNRKLMFIFAVICITVFCVFYYIFFFLGNNKSINQEEIVDDILNKFNEYEANIQVKVISNKNENIYEMQQEVSDEVSKTVVNSPDNVKNLIIELTNNKLVITNTKLNMQKIYEGYEAILNNSLFLNTFANDYKNNESKMYVEDDEIIFETKIQNNSNTYSQYKELHLNKENKLPKELIIKDNTKKNKISIIYNDIKIK